MYFVIKLVIIFQINYFLSFINLGAYNPCEKNNGGCKALCLLSPNLGRTCACPQDFILAPDNMNCIANCSSSHFVCANTFKCIPFWWHCDKHVSVLLIAFFNIF